VFQTWGLHVARKELEAQRMEVARLENRLGKKKESIWSMNKAELVELARQELGMSQVKAEKETLVTLRQRIKDKRDMEKVTDDPLAVMPKGASRLGKEELLKVCQERGIPTGPDVTKPQMLCRLRDQVEDRLTLSTMIPETASTRSEASIGQMDVDGDWEKVPGSKAGKRK